MDTFVLFLLNWSKPLLLQKSNRMFLYFQFGSYFIRLSNEELNLRQQVRDLKAEQGSISMSDEFANYMKLQRKIDKLVEQVKKMGET